MNVLLIEKGHGRHHRPNLALARFSTMHKAQGDKVTHLIVDSRYQLPAVAPDKVYVSIVFSWDILPLMNFMDRLSMFYPHLKEKGMIEVGGVAPYFMKDFITDNFGVEPHTTCSRELDQVVPDPAFYNDDDSSYVFTSRGCPNNCSFCIVPKCESDAYVIENWRDQINMSAKKIVVCDNNILATGDHCREVFEYLTEIAHRDGTRIPGSRKVREVEFDGGFDFRRINSENIELIRQVKHSKIRLAWDDVKYESKFDSAMRFLLEAFPKVSSRGLHEEIEVFVLYNCEFTRDALEDTLYRIYKLFHHYRVMPYAMRYMPLDTLYYKQYVSPLWDPENSVDVARWANSRSILLSVPNFNYYVGRQDNGKTLGRAVDQQALIGRMASEYVRPGIDYSRTFKENSTYLRQQVGERVSVLKNIA